LLILACVAGTVVARAQQRAHDDSAEFGPVVRAYLGYLKNEQEVVDDRISRREISRSYYVRNSNRIRALRQMAIRIARENGNDYLPEMDAAAGDELGSLFEEPPKPASLRVGEVYSNTYKFLGTVRSGNLFYVFARLDPYEQADLMAKENAAKENAKPVQATQPAAPAPVSDQATSRPRRTGMP
jgi:hypothetical protein